MRTPDEEIDDDYREQTLTKVGIEAVGIYIMEANTHGTFRDYDPDPCDFVDAPRREYHTVTGYDAGPDIAELLSYIEPEIVRALLAFYHAKNEEQDT
jgi:hypothetical protein